MIETAYDRIASRALFVGLSPSDIEAEGLTYRKGKNFDSVKDALAGGFRRGAGKVEREIATASTAVARVLKPSKGASK